MKTKGYVLGARKKQGLGLKEVLCSKLDRKNISTVSIASAM
jgi:hypothetical protein